MKGQLGFDHNTPATFNHVFGVFQRDARDHPAVEEVRGRLEADSRFGQHRGQQLNRGGGSSPLHLEQIIAWWAWRANAFGPVVADEELDTFLESDENPVLVVTWLHGPKVEESTTLTDTIEIVPPREMPFSKEREESLVFSDPNVWMAEVASSALVSRISVPKFKASAVVNVTGDLHLAHRDVALLLNTFPQVSSVGGYETTYFPDYWPPGAWGGGGGGQVIRDVVPRRNGPLRLPSDYSMEALVRGLTGPETKRGTWLRRTLDRLALAKCRVGAPHNQALDLGIALEMLLLHDHKDRTQLSLTLRLRGAWLLGKTPDERKAVERVLRDAYQIRSDVAHKGASTTLENAGFDPYNEPLASHMEVAERVARTLIARPDPDWNSLILGAERADRLP